MPILDAGGQPMRALPSSAMPHGDLAVRRRQPLAALQGGSIAAYDAADPWNRDMAGWGAWLGSPDTEGNPYRDMLVARIRDLVRNDGWASGAVTKLVDAVVGGYALLVAEPDLAYLRQFSPAFDEVWAEEFGEVIEARWRHFAEDPIGLWADISRRHTFSEMSGLAFRTRIVDGDEIAISHWEPDRVGPGRAQYSTCFQLMDPDRLSNPFNQPDRPYMRGGVQIDDYGAAIGYHLRRAHQADWFVPDRAYTWEYVDRETAWGRPIVVHDFDSDRAAQHRSPGGILKPVVGRLRMLANYDATELQASVVNAVLAAWIESPFDHSLLAEGLEGSPVELKREMLAYQTDRMAFHRDQPMALNGVRIPLAYPGERINMNQATRPATNFGEFEGAVQRNIASAIAGLAAPEFSGNWAEVNYSAAKAARNVSYKSVTRMRKRHFARFNTPLYSNWLEEDFDRREMPLPNGAPSFLEARAAYSGCAWYGPGSGYIDELAERRGYVLGLDAGTDTLKELCASQGKDWRKVVRQRGIEYRAFEGEGLPHATWQSGADDAQHASAAPEAR